MGHPPIIGVMLAAIPACLAARTAGEVAHYAMSYQDCTSTCSDAVACEVDGKSKFTEQVHAHTPCQRPQLSRRAF